MEASSTTVNISSPATEAQPEAPKVTIGGNGAVMHSHGPNFGRYVADCPGCIKKYPDGPPKRGSVKRTKGLVKLEAERQVQDAVKKALASQGTIQVDGLLNEIESLKRKLAEANERPLYVPPDVQLPKNHGAEDPMAALVSIMLQKEAKQAQKELSQEQRAEQSRQQMLEIEMQAIAMRKANQDACSHTKENGRTAINGQVHNDGLYHPFCQRCFKTFTPVVPRGENIQNAVMN